MRLASQVLSGAVAAAVVPEAPLPVLVPVPAPEMWDISDEEPGMRCEWSRGDAMRSHWLTRSRERICLPCKAAHKVLRGRRQVSQADVLREVEARLEGLTQDELATLKLYGDALSFDVWEDPHRCNGV
jgi:hypothetical protein